MPETKGGDKVEKLPSLIMSNIINHTLSLADDDPIFYFFNENAHPQETSWFWEAFSRALIKHGVNIKDADKPEDLLPQIKRLIIDDNFFLFVLRTCVEQAILSGSNPFVMAALACAYVDALRNALGVSDNIISRATDFIANKISTRGLNESEMEKICTKITRHSSLLAQFMEAVSKEDAKKIEEIKKTLHECKVDITGSNEEVASRMRRIVANATADVAYRFSKAPPGFDFSSVRPKGEEEKKAFDAILNGIKDLKQGDRSNARTLEHKLQDAVKNLRTNAEGNIIEKKTPPKTRLNEGSEERGGIEDGEGEGRKRDGNEPLGDEERSHFTGNIANKPRGSTGMAM